MEVAGAPGPWPMTETAEQEDLFLKSMDREFQAFHAQNPHVLTAFMAMAYEALEARERVGAKCIWENLRWKYNVKTKDPRFVLNNSMTSRYARLAVQRDPMLKEVFEFRRLKS